MASRAAGRGVPPAPAVPPRLADLRDRRGNLATRSVVCLVMVVLVVDGRSTLAARRADAVPVGDRRRSGTWVDREGTEDERLTVGQAPRRGGSPALGGRRGWARPTRRRTSRARKRRRP